MARFVGHESCPSCGSRDNLARYDDGSAFCFGCKYHEGRDKRARRSLEIAVDDDSTPKLPDDTGTAYSKEAVSWLAQYYVTVEKAISSGIRWSESKQQLIFLLEDGCWQARNFRVGSKKYFNAGDINDQLKTYRGTSSDTRGMGGLGNILAVVEDCVSAIRIAGCSQEGLGGPQYDAMPVLGSHVSTKRLNRMASLYQNMIFWMDADKMVEAQETARRASMLGIHTKVIYTEQDPKCYTNEQIRSFLK